MKIKIRTDFFEIIRTKEEDKRIKEEEEEESERKDNSGDGQVAE